MKKRKTLIKCFAAIGMISSLSLSCCIAANAEMTDPNLTNGGNLGKPSLYYYNPNGDADVAVYNGKYMSIQTLRDNYFNVSVNSQGKHSNTLMPGTYWKTLEESDASNTPLAYDETYELHFKYDSPLTSFIPKEYFNKECDKLLVGKEYGYYIHTELESDYSYGIVYDGMVYASNYGTYSEHYYHNYIMLFDINNKYFDDGRFSTKIEVVLQAETITYNENKTRIYDDDLEKDPMDFGLLDVPTACPVATDHLQNKQAQTLIRFDGEKNQETYITVPLVGFGGALANPNNLYIGDISYNMGVTGVSSSADKSLTSDTNNYYITTKSTQGTADSTDEYLEANVRTNKVKRIDKQFAVDQTASWKESMKEYRKKAYYSTLKCLFTTGKLIYSAYTENVIGVYKCASDLESQTFDAIYSWYDYNKCKESLIKEDEKIIHIESLADGRGISANIDTDAFIDLKKDSNGNYNEYSFRLEKILGAPYYKETHTEGKVYDEIEKKSYCALMEIGSYIVIDTQTNGDNYSNPLVSLVLGVKGGMIDAYDWNSNDDFNNRLSGISEFASDIKQNVNSVKGFNNSENKTIKFGYITDSCRLVFAYGEYYMVECSGIYNKLYKVNYNLANIYLDNAYISQLSNNVYYDITIEDKNGSNRASAKQVSIITNVNSKRYSTNRPTC